MRKFFTWFIAVGLLFILSFAIFNGCGDTAQTVQREFGASALLKKYEDFKDLSAAIDKSRANLQVYEEDLNSMSQTTSDDKYYYNQRKSEVLGLISVYNRLVADYNSRMSKFNYRFTNKGDLPQSNLEPLPREYKDYILSIKHK